MANRIRQKTVKGKNRLNVRRGDSVPSGAEGCGQASSLVPKGIWGGSVTFGRSLLFPGQLQLQLGLSERELTGAARARSSPLTSRPRPGFIPAYFKYSAEKSETKAPFTEPCAMNGKISVMPWRVLSFLVDCSYSL